MSATPRTRSRKAAGAPADTAPTGAGRVAIETVWPEIDGGRTAIKRIIGETLEVWADIFSDGHDRIAAEVVWRPLAGRQWQRAPMRLHENDRWVGRLPLAEAGRFVFTIEAWRDPYASWREEIGKKRSAGVDVGLEISEGVHIAERASELADEPGVKTMIDDLLARLEEAADPEAQYALLVAPEAAALMARHAERVNLSRYPVELPVTVERLRARFSAWYEMFPRSASGDPDRHGTFADVIARMPYVRDHGFDVLYFPPIHPIGTTNRKGRNNALKAEAGDPGSVYAIGGEAGGHDAIHPDLGTLDDFREMVAAAAGHGLEIALDFAIQCSPDHPWIREHPEWFEWRPDGTLKYAENPPKKYEDISNVHFYGASLPSLWYALRDVVLFWASNGVTIFRVDNPHTKPIPFWEWMIREVNDRFPDVIFLAEAFTRPKMMKKLAKIGFQQSYTYFTWRNTKAELREYITELAGDMGEYYRPNFFANTPDINPYYLQTSGRAGFVVRATLAATLSASWGIYSGFELCEAAPLPGREEYLDSEKYEIRARDFGRSGNIRDHIAALNRIRNDNPALQDFRNTKFVATGNDNVIGYYRLTRGKDNLVLVLVNLDPHHAQSSGYEVPLWEFGQPDHGSVEVEDLLLGYRFNLAGKHHAITLDPADRSAVIWRLRPPGANP